MGRQSRISKVTVLIIGLIIILTGSYIAWATTHPKSSKSTNAGAAKYVSFGGGYLFNIPAKFVVDDTILPGITVIYPENSPPQAGKSLEGLYANGTVAVQPIAALKDNNVKAFQDYINNIFTVDLRQALHSASDVRLTKQGGVDAIKVFALAADGKRLRVVYAVDLTQPVMIVAKEESDALKVIGGSTEDLKTSKLKTDIDLSAQTTKDVVESLQKGDTSNVRKKGSKEFNKTMTDSKLKSELDASARYLNRSITIMGGSYNTNDFVAQLVFQPKTKDEVPVGGTVSLHKEGKAWKLQALQLPG